MTSQLTKVLIGTFLLTGLAACSGQQSLYSWNGYESELLSYYKNPGELNVFAEKLLEDIGKAEEDGRVPPGLYAEYGYAMLELGDADTAIIYFQKERDRWPESAFLMESVISRLGDPEETVDP